MSHPLLSSTEQSSLFAKLALRVGSVKRTLQGLAADFWHDGNWAQPDEQDLSTAPASADAFQPKPMQLGEPWHAIAGEIPEKLWGEGQIYPADEYVTERLIGPLGLMKDMTILDLSAGLGTRARKTAEAFLVYVSGLESDKNVASRGAGLLAAYGPRDRASLKSFDPNALSLSSTYDRIIGREILSTISDKKFFVDELVKHLKPSAQVSFTDYIINPECRDHQGITTWLGVEKNISPLSLVEMAELWAKAGITLRVHDDMTDFFKAEVKAGLGRFSKLFASGVKPDEETKRAINETILIWAHRLSAIEAGMRFYRFYGVR